MKKKLIVLLCALLVVLGYAQEKEIKGIINDGKNTLADVVVKIKDDNSGTYTDTHGSYSIFAKEGDVLVFSYPGMRTQEIIVEDVTKFLNISLLSDAYVLDEVIVKKKRFKTQARLRAEYNSNKNLVNTAFGILNKESVNFAMRIITEDQINLSGVDLAATLQSRFPGIRVDRRGLDPLKPVIFLRGAGIGFFPAIYDVDGLIFTEFPDFIQPANVERIAVLSGLGLGIKYGGQANGGIIVINTKGANYFPEPGSKKPYDLARLRDNIYNEDAKTTEELSKGLPNYLSILSQVSSFEEAKKVYREWKSIYAGTPFFFLDNYIYFKKRWSNEDFANTIIDENLQSIANNPIALKALAYNFQEQGAYERANTVLKEVFLLRPDYPQSYMDLANSYRDLGNYKKAATLYARYEYLKAEKLILAGESDFTKIINREYNNLISLHSNALISESAFTRGFLKEEFNGTRLVFEWSNSEAEFNLQFVNPENQFYTWKHSQAYNVDRIQDEKINKYSSNEYLIDDSLPGLWKINVTYLGNKSLTPTYLKTTIYYNYGTTAQYKEVRVHKLALKNVKQQILELSNSGSLNFK